GADARGGVAGRRRHRRGKVIAAQLLPQCVEAFLARGVLIFQAGPDPRDGIADGLGLARLTKARQGKPGEQPAPHRLIPTVAVLALSHSCAARNRSKPGTLALRLTSFHLLSTPCACSRSMRL